MSLNQEQVKKIAHLARLNLSEEEITLYMSQLSSILDFVEQMKSADTTQIEALAHPLDEAVQRLRTDEITEIDLRSKYQSIAPQTEAGLYLVPKVIEEA
jgi:aspartyl-tRNA(Asn)/glutamyl-tRNA(Gln) amidotransferase subunit C